MKPEEVLQRYWGYDRFRPLQKEAVEAALSGADSLVLMATGGGKSICYQQLHYAWKVCVWLFRLLLH